MKGFIVSYTRAAIADIADAVAWYEAQAAGLGDRFAAALLQKTEAVTGNPFSCGIRYDDTRRKRLATFPYMIHYVVAEDASEIIIDAVWHTSRQPVWERPREE